MTEIFTARSVEEAKEMAAEKFGKKISEIRFEILDEGKKGLFGIGSKEAKVKATVADSAPVQETAPKAAPEAPKTTTAPEKKAEPVTKTVAAEKSVVTTETKAAEKASEPVKAEKTEKNAAGEAENAPEALDEEAYSLDNFTLIEDEALINPKVKLAMDYITSILRAMDVDVEFKVYQNETGAVINLESDNNGTIIGRRGETLDSIQYLCSIIANKGDKDYYRITIDCLGYRNKRKDTLEQLAAKVAKSVLRTGRSQPLEPMNPYERRVIHSAISNIEGVSSRSVGEEPYRKIIISSNNPRRGGGRRDNRRDGGRRNDNRRNGGQRNRDREVNMERRSVNLSTSFEKDYKRPKPEDEIQGGLYGKIEL
ncbi:MAG: KH domain-containing protein [Ruminococcus sp.]|uniref:RNA-binding cell elongation regulator Jag/EloR n=1 Tax=Ruminococcus sp. TaxID=41978 RepID=UPI0025FE3254|nr:RNA-binding cell elongation regulator Jag/EloR [Ruminococcus sp.]MBR5683865.1 KH domain-containing protein [Ruminococcus sp.]